MTNRNTEKLRCRTLPSATRLIFLACLMMVRMDMGESFLSPHFQFHPHRRQKQCDDLSSPSPSALFSTTSKRSRSRVSDPSGATPPQEEEEYPKIKMEDLPETQYDQYKPVIPHQPWRRGETAGCEDPIDAPWRKEAERRIKLAVEMVGGVFVDVTWFLTCAIVTIGDVESMPRDCYPPSGVVVRFKGRPDVDENIYIDPNDPNPEPIWGADEMNRVVYERDVDLEMDNDIKSKTYAKPDREAGETDDDLGLDPDRDVPLYVAQECRDDELLREYQRRQLLDATEPKEVVLTPELLRENDVNKYALSSIGDAIYKALEEKEDELQVLARHEIMLCAEGPGNVLETQKQFDAKRGCKVAVHTQDPWQSNRVLKGILLDRNTLDVYIKKQGRMVTIPNNFVTYVELVDPKDHMPHPEYLQRLNEALSYKGNVPENVLYSSTDEEEEDEVEEDEDGEYDDDEDEYEEEDIDEDDD